METKVNKYELMRYQPNKKSFSLALLGLLLVVLSTFLLLNSVRPIGFSTILKILVIIAILLFSFLSAEKSKSYNYRHSQILVGIGAVVFLLNFWYPLTLLIATINEDVARLGMPIINPDANSMIIPGNGYVRFVLAVILLTGAAVSLIIAGITGMQKSKGLANYMESLDTAK